MDENNHEWIKEVKEKPNINHLHVGGFGKVVGHTDEHCDEN